jgi:hypothetical protein
LMLLSWWKKNARRHLKTASVRCFSSKEDLAVQDLVVCHHQDQHPSHRGPHHLRLALPTPTSTVSLLHRVLEETTPTPATTPMPALKLVAATPAASHDTSLVSVPTGAMLHRAPMRQDPTKAKLVLLLERRLPPRIPPLLLLRDI